jgi:hypothetical protein
LHFHKIFITFHCYEQRSLVGTAAKLDEEEWISTILELSMCRTTGILLLLFCFFTMKKQALFCFSWVVWTLSSIFVATWNVAGRSPPSNLRVDDWLHSSPPADIYVLGYELMLLSIYSYSFQSKLVLTSQHIYVFSPYNYLEF